MGQAADREASSCNAAQLPRFLVYLFFSLAIVCPESADQAPAVTTPTVSRLVLLVNCRQTFDPCWPPFLQGSNISQILAQILTLVVFKPRILELERFIEKRKQTCQGSVIGLPPHKTWGGWVPQLPQPLAQWVPQRVKVENFLYILRSSGPRRVQCHQ